METEAVGFDKIVSELFKGRDAAKAQAEATAGANARIERESKRRFVGLIDNEVMPVLEELVKTCAKFDVDVLIKKEGWD